METKELWIELKIMGSSTDNFLFSDKLVGRFLGGKLKLAHWYDVFEFYLELDGATR